jgi:hypothetical protein
MTDDKVRKLLLEEALSLSLLLDQDPDDYHRKLICQSGIDNQHLVDHRGGRRYGFLVALDGDGDVFEAEVTCGLS